MDKQQNKNSRKLEVFFFQKGQSLRDRRRRERREGKEMKNALHCVTFMYELSISGI